MTVEELKKKIVDVLRENIEYELHYFPDDNYTEVEVGYDKLADALYAAGYRKQSDVIKEFVEKVKDKFFYDLDSERSIDPVSIYRFTDKEIDELAAEFGAEVEE